MSFFAYSSSSSTRALQTRLPMNVRRAPFARRSTSGSSAARVDHVVEGVVRLHPVDEQRRRHAAPRVVPDHGARASARRSAVRRHRGLARSAGGHPRRRHLGCERLELGPDEERLAELGTARSSERGRRGSARTRPSREPPAGGVPPAPGVRETAKRSESCSCRNTVPGAIAPPTISSSRTRAMSSALVESVLIAFAVYGSARIASNWICLGSEKKENFALDRRLSS